MKSGIIALGALVMLGLMLTASAATRAAASPHAATRAAPNTPTATPTCPPSWSVVTTPTLGLDSAELYGVKAISTDDVWAVGVYFTTTSGLAAQAVDRDWAYKPHKHSKPRTPSDPQPMGRTVATRWDGSAWTVASSPSPNLQDNNVLMSVDALAPDDVWAAGYYIDPLGLAQTLVERWNGTAWSVVPSPDLGPYADNQLFGIQAVAADDVWAVGIYSNDAGIFQTLALHWNGTDWSVVPSPNLGTYDNILYDLAVVSPGDIWAAGYYYGVAGARSLVLHWDGSAWDTVTVPNLGASSTILMAIDATSANDVWAAGSTYNDYRGQRAFSLHWDGSSWTILPTPTLGGAQTGFNAIDALGPDDVWAVGSLYIMGGYTPPRALAEHWDGSAWENVSTPSLPQASYATFESVSMLSSEDVWAVGSLGAYNPYYLPLAEHYSTQCVPSDCSITFSDVHSTDYFYYPVLYLYCRGAISGYSDNTFRPFNSVTRGQLTKILTVAKDWELQMPNTPHFQDVQPWDPFFTYVETAYAHNVISGYADGTFRPGNDITRAQLSKVIVLAQQWPTDTTGGPHFSDVPPTDPFYGYVETVYNRGVMSGYADTTFRPGNSATRGQVAKIIFNALTAP